MTEDTRKAIERAYWSGVEAGVRRFAWWKDGVEYVGSCGKTLKRAIRDIDIDSGKPCWHPHIRGDGDVKCCTRCGGVVS